MSTFSHEFEKYLDLVENPDMAEEHNDGVNKKNQENQRKSHNKDGYYNDNNDFVSFKEHNDRAARLNSEREKNPDETILKDLQAWQSERDFPQGKKQTSNISANILANPYTTSAEHLIAPPEPTSFPWGMLCLAALFDLVGLVPVLNLITETLAGLIFGWWQKGYNPKLDPLLTFIVAKIIDAISLGILPSNIGIVVYAYIKKKAAAAAQTPLGQYAAGKMLKTSQ